jgi:hypothetical protein
VDPHCFDVDLEQDPDPAQILDADPDPDPGGGEGIGQPKTCIPPGKILGTPLILIMIQKNTSRIRNTAKSGHEIGKNKFILRNDVPICENELPMFYFIQCSGSDNTAAKKEWAYSFI